MTITDNREIKEVIEIALWVKEPATQLYDSFELFSDLHTGPESRSQHPSWNGSHWELQERQRLLLASLEMHTRHTIPHARACMHTHTLTPNKQYSQTALEPKPNKNSKVTRKGCTRYYLWVYLNYDYKFTIYLQSWCQI